MSNLTAEIEFIESVIFRIEETLNLPELNDNIRVKRDREIKLARSIHKRLKELEKPLKFALYSEFMGVYINWHKQLVGIGPKLGPAQGKALKEIIAYLIQECKEKTEEQALNAWRLILVNWEHLSPFLKQQKGLLQINKNITEILDQIRNGNYKQNNKTRDLERELGL